MVRKLKLVTDELVRELFGQLNGVLEVLSERIASKSANSLVVTADNDAQTCRFSLMSQDGKIMSSTAINFPLESMLVDVKTDETNENLVFTLKNGVKTIVPVSSIVNGLATTEQLNAERKARELADKERERKITTESLARVNADANLIKSIGDEATARQNADADLEERIATETRNRVEAVAAFPLIVGEDGYVYGKE